MRSACPKMVAATLLVIPAQATVFGTSVFAARAMAASNWPGFASGGALWFPDLTKAAVVIHWGQVCPLPSTSTCKPLSQPHYNSKHVKEIKCLGCIAIWSSYLVRRPLFVLLLQTAALLIQNKLCRRGTSDSPSECRLWHDIRHDVA
jgi:hypothetical protein